MKEKIIIFLVGLLLGSIISTASIYIYTVANNSNNNNNINIDKQNMQMMENDINEKLTDENGGTPPELPNNTNNNGDVKNNGTTKNSGATN